MTSRMLSRAAVAGVALLGLSGCSTTHSRTAVQHEESVAPGTVSTAPRAMTVTLGAGDDLGWQLYAKQRLDAEN